MTRTKALLIVVPLALSVAVLLLLPLFLDKEKLLDLATTAIREQTGATLTVGGAIDLELIPRIGISLTDVSLAMPGEQQAGLQIRSLQLGLQLLPLFTGRVEVQTLSLDGLTSRISASKTDVKIDSSQMSDEELDTFYTQRRKAQTEAAAGSRPALAIPLALNVGTLSLTDSKLELVNADGAAPTIIEVQYFKAQNLNLEARPIKLQAKIRLPTEQGIELELRGTVRIDQQRQVVVLETVEMEAAGVVAHTIKLRALGEVDINRQLADLQLVLEIAETRGEGTLHYATFESPHIDTTLHFNLFDPALLALAGPEATAGTEDNASGGDAPLPLVALRNIDTHANLTVDRAVFGNHNVEDLKLTLRGLDGVININSLTGVVHGGRLALEGTFNGKHNTASLATSGTLAGLDIASALAATEVDPIATGQANLDWNLTSKGRTQNELLAGLNGAIKLTTAEIVLQDISIEGMLCKAVALTNQETLTATFPPSTRFKTLVADVELADGRALLRPLRAELPHITLTGNGSYELLSSDFKATFKARLSPELETLDRACRVSKRLTAIDWPVDCAGNANHEPAQWCRVDTQEIIEDLTKNEAQRKLQKEAVKLLNKLFK